MKLIATFCFILCFSYLHSQNVNLKYLNKLVKAGICRELNSTLSKDCEEKQIQYINACETLGDYYYKIKNYKYALKYYQLVAFLGTYTDGELQDDKTIKLRNKVAEKAADIYYYGIGVKKDTKAAFYLYFRPPLFYSDFQRLHYSKLFFNSQRQIFYPVEKKINSDSIFKFGINPFYITESSVAAKLANEIENILSKCKKSDTSILKIKFFYGGLIQNMSNQAYLNRQEDWLEVNLRKKIKNQISIELIVSKEGYKCHSLVLPMLLLELEK
jgi:hypothetical protein